MVTASVADTIKFHLPGIENVLYGLYGTAFNRFKERMGENVLSFA